ncbi:MAG: AI-2E family transporter [Alphaproteobacteria bacterium]|nr:AI-2E family transporter [Alphaproteobacteria bacterium]
MADRDETLERTASREAQVNNAWILITVGLIVAGLYFAREILVPFALSVLLSFLLAPAARWLRRMRVGRITAVLVTVLLAFVAIFGFGAVVGEEVAQLGQKLPEYQHNMRMKIRSLQGNMPGAGLFERASAMFRDLGDELAGRSGAAGSSPPALAAPTAPGAPVPVVLRQPDPVPWQVVQSVVGPLLQPLATGGLVVVFVVLILLRREDLRDRLLRLAGERDLHRTTEAMNDAGQRVSRYLLMQLIVNTCYGVPVGLGLAVIGIPNAALWGMLAVLLRFIPYLGVIIAAAFPVALAIAVDPGWSLLAWTLALLLVIELVISNIVEPWVYGASTGLSPVAVIMAATFWTWLWGPIGLLLSTPLTVCLVVLGRHVPQLQFLDVLLGNRPVLAPEETLYQRLLANDPEEATEQAEEFAGDRSIAAFFDEVAIPALAMAQADSDRGAMTVERRARVTAGFETMIENLGEDGLVENGPEASAPDEGFIACVAGRNELDEAAAKLLVHLLRLNGYPARVFAADALSAANLHRLSLKGAAVVCLSLLSTSSPARARYLVRRLRRRAPRARLLVGFWGEPPASLSVADTIEATAADQVFTSLRDAFADIAATIASVPAAALADRPAPVQSGRLASEPA